MYIGLFRGWGDSWLNLTVHKLIKRSLPHFGFENLATFRKAVVHNEGNCDVVSFIIKVFIKLGSSRPFGQLDPSAPGAQIRLTYLNLPFRCLQVFYISKARTVKNSKDTSLPSKVVTYQYVRNSNIEKIVGDCVGDSVFGPKKCTFGKMPKIFEMDRTFVNLHPMNQ